jgi:hypothetical protein
MPANLAAMRQQVQRILARQVGSIQVTADEEFSFPYESTRIFVRVDPFGENGTTVSVYAITNADIPPSPELFHYVATEGSSWTFGHLGAGEAEDGTVTTTFRQTLLGEYLDPLELRAAVVAVATTADDLDDQIKERFGGKRMADL